MCEESTKQQPLNWRLQSSVGFLVLCCLLIVVFDTGLIALGMPKWLTSYVTVFICLGVISVKLFLDWFIPPTITKPDSVLVRQRNMFLGCVLLSLLTLIAPIFVMSWLRATLDVIGVTALDSVPVWVAYSMAIMFWLLTCVKCVRSIFTWHHSD